MELEKIKCSRCQEDMPKLRLEKYGYDFCVNCSDVKPKVGRIRVIGEGDYTVTELDVLDQDVARKLQEMENTSRGVKNNPLEILDYDEDETADDLKALQVVTEKALTGEDTEEPEVIELPDLLDEEDELDDSNISVEDIDIPEEDED